MDNLELVRSLKSELAIPLPENGRMDVLRAALAMYINDLIEKDFQRLVNLLYRLDVSENKVKEMLGNSSSDAGLIIADLVIERQMQKIKTRKEFEKKPRDINEDEKW